MRPPAQQAEYGGGQGDDHQNADDVHGGDEGGVGTDHQRAEAHFLDAIKVARAQDAKSLELRAMASFARLRQEQGRLQEAGDLLAPIYDWFTEGFDTLDLVEAKALLDELN